MAEPRIQYATTSDGVSIAYYTLGQGPPVVVCSNIWASHLTENWKADGVAEAMLELAEYFTIVRYDGRGSGLSDREPVDFSLDARLRDLGAILARLQLDRFAILSAAHGSLAAVAYTAAHPERVTRLVLVSPYASGDELYRESPSMKFVASLTSVTEEQWEFVSESFAARMLGKDSPRVDEAARLYRASMEPGHLLAFREANRSIDVTDLLPKIAAPTLIVHKGDTDFPIAFARKFASLIPNAEFTTVGGGTGPFLAGLERSPIIDFLSGGTVTSRPERAPVRDAGAALASEPPVDKRDVRTVLFTDLVGHTEMMSRLGDERGRDVLREHERITREVLKQHGGTEVKTMGDGFMASFGSVTKAVECAMVLQQAFAEREGEPLNVRVGLNAGEPIEEDGDLFGATVILASRIAAKAGGGEILVADTVRGLCSGKGFLFSDRGEFAAKGFEEPVRVYEVRWRE